MEQGLLATDHAVHTFSNGDEAESWMGRNCYGCWWYVTLPEAKPKARKSARRG